MPYKFETTKTKIPRDLNRNVKISLEDREKIREDYKVLKSQRKTALKWNVSRRLIQFILDPEKEQRNKELYAIRQAGGRYYNREKHNKQVSEHRKYKQKLFKKNKLIGEIKEWKKIN